MCPKSHGGRSQRKRRLNHVVWFMLPKPSHPSPLERLNCCVLQTEVLAYWRENVILRTSLASSFIRWGSEGSLWADRPIPAGANAHWVVRKVRSESSDTARSLLLYLFIDTNSYREHGPFFCHCLSTKESFFIMLQPSECAEKLGCPRNSWCTFCSLLHLLFPLPQEAEKSRLF